MDPNTLNLDPDLGPDPDLGLYHQLWKKKLKILFKKIFFEKVFFFFNYKNKQTVIQRNFILSLVFELLINILNLKSCIFCLHFIL